MRLKITKSKNAQSLYVIRSTYENGKHSSKIVEKLGTYAELSKIHNDPIAWAKQYIRQLNDKEKEATRKVLLQFSQDKSIPKDFQKSFNIGYLFLQYIYYMLGLHGTLKPSAPCFGWRRSTVVLPLRNSRCFPSMWAGAVCRMSLTPAKIVGQKSTPN